MTFFLVFLIAFFIGYVYGYKIRPNQRLRETIKDVREKCTAVLEEGNKGVYRTIVMDNDKSSELVVEVKELAVTKNGQAKVQYLSAYYKNPDFRTKKGNALLEEVHGLLGEYLPMHEIEWFDTTSRHKNIKDYVDALDKSYTV
jgi:hypothetical protein